MIKIRYITALSLLLLISIQCKSRIKDTAALENDPYFRERVMQRLDKKRRAAELRLQFSESRFGKQLAKYKPVIKKYSKRYGFDWRLITAQIVQESGFKIQARSRVGAHGLMQLMPGTARELSKELDIEFIMKNPRENITAGIYHLRKQYNLFPDAPYDERIKLALASYNCGVGRVFDAQDISRYYKKATNRWQNVRPNLALLKSTDWQLHLQVWSTGRPRFGYFYGYNETINYVDNIWRLYKGYREFL